MATTIKPLYRGAASTTTTTTLYTASGVTALVTNIAVSNTSSSSQTFTLYLNGVLIHNLALIDAYSTIYIDLKQSITNSQTIQGGASATSVNFHINGVEIS